MAERFTVVDVDELEPAGPTGSVRFLRRALGATAFGFNWFELLPGAAGPEHDETGSKQEEVMTARSSCSPLGGSSGSTPRPCARYGPGTPASRS